MKLTPELARERFRTARVARLATVTADGQPHLVPFTFVVDGDQILHAVDDKPKTTTALRRIANIVENPAVCALVDSYAEDWTSLWWARADGTATVHTDTDEIAKVGALLAAKYPQYADQYPAGPVIALTVDRWSGWSAQPIGQ
ncbi:MAG: TIGR03668 family PPOX class F420-dependent oxidoreductase [Streptosporangiales bacterium]|nr:TIGR03668 family PPOX class F420-dependent oxidoreductase [Streptosporangiales bacterium]